MFTRMCMYLSCLDLLLEALNCVLKDEGFQLPTKPAISALTAAENLHRWASNREQWHIWCVATELVTALRTCTSIDINGSSGQAPQQTRQEKMWSKYHQVRTLETFKSKWHEFLEKSIGSQSIPLFWQYNNYFWTNLQSIGEGNIYTSPTWWSKCWGDHLSRGKCTYIVDTLLGMYMYAVHWRENSL